MSRTNIDGRNSVIMYVWVRLGHGLPGSGAELGRTDDYSLVLGHV